MQHDFEVRPQLCKVDETVQALRELVEPFLEPRLVVAFEVAVSEALTNVVVHGYPTVADGDTISVNLTVSTTDVQVLIFDRGKPGPEGLFDRVPALNEIDFLQESGRGLALISHHTDKTIYTPSLSGNQLVLMFDRSRSSPPNPDQ